MHCTVMLSVSACLCLHSAISTGLVENIPYDAADTIISLENLPKNIGFKRPSLYGVRQLQIIIAQKSKFEMHGELLIIVFSKRDINIHDGGCAVMCHTL